MPSSSAQLWNFVNRVLIIVLCKLLTVYSQRGSFAENSEEINAVNACPSENT
tara:strand:+ start:7523 stop:7678 length:156 start_codon:yes stop_codon:yes gene_type:complete